MVETTRSATQRPPAPAKVRILGIANDLFYRDGIRTVGIDRLISDSAVTKATFYKHYRSKDILITDYMTARHEASAAELDRLISHASDPVAGVRSFASSIAAEIAGSAFRGDAFLNAAAEFSDPNHPVRRIVAEHRDAYTERLVELTRALGHPAPGDAADDLMLARDGAMSGGYAGDPIAATAALSRIVERVIAEARPAKK